MGTNDFGTQSSRDMQRCHRNSKKGLSFGAATELEVQMADLITSMVPSIEMVRMVNSGTEAVMSAIRAARGYTKKIRLSSSQDVTTVIQTLCW